MTDEAFKNRERDTLLTRCSSYRGCCGDIAWRGHLCDFHRGWINGWTDAEERFAEIVAAVPEERTDGE